MEPQGPTAEPEPSRSRIIARSIGLQATLMGIGWGACIVASAADVYHDLGTGLLPIAYPMLALLLLAGSFVGLLLATMGTSRLEPVAMWLGTAKVALVLGAIVLLATALAGGLQGLDLSLAALPLGLGIVLLTSVPVHGRSSRWPFFALAALGLGHGIWGVIVLVLVVQQTP